MFLHEEINLDFIFSNRNKKLAILRKWQKDVKKKSIQTNFITALSLKNDKRNANLHK